MVDFDRSQLFFVAEHHQIATDAIAHVLASHYSSIQLTFAFVEFADDRDAIRHWICNHAPLIRKWGAVIGFEKYIQNHPCNDGAQILDHLPKVRGVKPGRYSLYASIWLNGRAAADEVAQQALKEISADELGGFVKHGTGNCLVAKESVFVDRWRV
ncbi:hypothetical protein ACJZ2D_010541 [Fusarium nematophilum]